MKNKLKNISTFFITIFVLALVIVGFSVYYDDDKKLLLDYVSKNEDVINVVGKVTDISIDKRRYVQGTPNSESYKKYLLKVDGEKSVAYVSVRKADEKEAGNGFLIDSIKKR